MKIFKFRELIVETIGSVPHEMVPIYSEYRPINIRDAIYNQLTDEMWTDLTWTS